MCGEGQAKDCVSWIGSFSRRVGGFRPLRIVTRQRWHFFFFFLVLWIFGSERVDWSWAEMHLALRGKPRLFWPLERLRRGTTSTRVGLICCNGRLGFTLGG